MSKKKKKKKKTVLLKILLIIKHSQHIYNIYNLNIRI